MASLEQVNNTPQPQPGQAVPETDQLLSAHAGSVLGVQPRGNDGRYAARDSHIPNERLLSPEEKQAYMAAFEAVERTIEAYDQAEPGQEVEVPEGLRLKRDWSDTKTMHDQKQREHVEQIESSLTSGIGAHNNHKGVLQEKREALKQERWDERRKELEDAAKLRYGSIRLEKEPGLAKEVEEQVRTRAEGELGPRPLTQAEQAAKRETEQRQAKQNNALQEAAHRNRMARQKAAEEREKTSEAAKEFRRGFANSGHERKTSEEKIGTAGGMYIEAVQVEKGTQESTAVLNDVKKGLFAAVEGAGHEQLAEAIDSYYEENSKTPEDANEAKEQLKAALGKAGEAIRRTGKEGPISAAIARIEKIKGKNYLIYAKTGKAKLAIEGTNAAVHDLGSGSAGDLCSAIELLDEDRIMLSTAGMRANYTEQFKPDTTEASARSFADAFDKDGVVIVADVFAAEDNSTVADDNGSETKEPVEEFNDLSSRGRFKDLFYKAGARFTGAKMAAAEKIRKNKRNAVIGGIIGAGALYLASKYGLDLTNGGETGIDSTLPAEQDTNQPNAGEHSRKSLPSEMPEQSVAPGGEVQKQPNTDTLQVKSGSGFEDSFQDQYNLSDREAADLYWNHMQQYLQGAPGTYEISPGNIGISAEGTFNLPEDARKELEEYLRSKGKK